MLKLWQSRNVATLLLHALDAVASQCFFIMKKVLLLLCLSCTVYCGYTQVIISLIFGDKLNSDKIEFGIDGGLNWSELHGLPDSKSFTGFNLGFYFDFKLRNPSWMVNTGVIVKSPMGAGDLPAYSLQDAALDSAFAGGEVSRKIRYFNVPVSMKYYINRHIYAKAGIMLGLRNKAFDEFTNKVIDKEDLHYTLKTKDDYHPLDAGLLFGVGYRLFKGSGVNIGLQYYLGLIDVVIDDATPNQYNRSVYLTAGIPIGVAKSKKKAKATEQQ
jgi:hypothetical protein